MTASGVATRRVSLSATILWVVAVLTASCIFAVPSRAQTNNLVNAPVDPAVRVALRGQRAPWALPQNSRGAVPGDTTLQHLTLVLKRSAQQQQAFEQFLQQLQDPSSRNYHHFLTPIQVGKRFGASQHDLDAVSGWLRAQGLRVDGVANSLMMIDFSGNASQVGAAFGTEMRYYEVKGEKRIATAGDPRIPAAFEGIIQSISGLSTTNDHPYHGAGKAHRAEGDSPAGTFCNPTCSNFIFPADFATIYDLNSVTVDGSGQNVAIIGRSRVFDADVENFESLSGLAKKDPTVIIPPAGVDPGPPAGTGGTASGDQVEATLDVMRSTSVAPGATIDLVVSVDDNGVSGLRIAAQYVVDTNPVPAQIMNISFGACEADRTQSDVQFWDSLFSQGAAEGISTFVASGDAGAAGCDAYFQTPPQNQILSINYICASSYSTCVGGTEFADTADPAKYWNQNPVQAPPYESALGYIPEGGWNEPLNGGVTQAAASGGGFSVYIPTPPWQTGTGVPGTQGRYTPDIAFSASAHDGYFGCLAAGGGDCVVVDGGFSFEYFFGTSAAAPDMAGITALLNQQEQAPQGELNQRLYQLAATPTNLVFNDVTVATSGVTGCVLTTPSMCNNSTPSPSGLTGGLAGYLVTAGYDEVTGLGSINGANLLANWGTFTWTNTGSASNTVLAGQTTPAYTFLATPASGAAFAGAVNFSCAFAPADSTLTNSSCVFTPPSIAAGTSSPTGTAVSMTVATVGPNTETGTQLRRRADKRSPWLPFALPIAGVVMLGLASRKISKRSAIAIACVLLVLAGFMVACGGGSSSSPPVSVTVTPSTTVQLYANETGNVWPASATQEAFSATVNNSSNQSVTWAVTGPSTNGTIGATTGIYTSPATVPSPATVTVTATAAADTTKSGSGTVDILAATGNGALPAQYTVTVTATEGTTSTSQPVTLVVQ